MARERLFRFFPCQGYVEYALLLKLGVMPAGVNQETGGLEDRPPNQDQAARAAAGRAEITHPPDFPRRFGRIRRRGAW